MGGVIFSVESKTNYMRIGIKAWGKQVGFFNLAQIGGYSLIGNFTGDASALPYTNVNSEYNLRLDFPPDQRPDLIMATIIGQDITKTRQDSQRLARLALIVLPNGNRYKTKTRDLNHSMFDLSIKDDLGIEYIFSDYFNRYQDQLGITGARQFLADLGKNNDETERLLRQARNPFYCAGALLASQKRCKINTQVGATPELPYPPNPSAPPDEDGPTPQPVSFPGYYSSSHRWGRSPIEEARFILPKSIELDVAIDQDAMREQLEKAALNAVRGAKALSNGLAKAAQNAADSMDAFRFSLQEAAEKASQGQGEKEKSHPQESIQITATDSGLQLIRDGDELRTLDFLANHFDQLRDPRWGAILGQQAEKLRNISGTLDLLSRICYDNLARDPLLTWPEFSEEFKEDWVLAQNILYAFTQIALPKEEYGSLEDRYTRFNADQKRAIAATIRLEIKRTENHQPDTLDGFDFAAVL